MHSDPQETEDKPPYKFFAVISLNTQKIISEHENDAEAIREGLNLTANLREAGKAEEASDIRVLNAFDLSKEELEEIRDDPAKANLIVLVSRPNQRGIYCFEPDMLNPLKLDPRVIPYGMYCYDWEADPNPPPKKDENDLMHGYRIRRCPYFEIKTFNGVQISWCNFLGAGAENLYANGGQSHEDFSLEHEKLLHYFGSQEALDKALPLALLSDCVKCCGIM